MDSYENLIELEQERWELNNASLSDAVKYDSGFFLNPAIRQIIYKDANAGLHARLDELKEGAIVLEIGCGAGMQSLSYAVKYPTIQFIAVDLSDAIMALGIAKAKEHGIKNIKYIASDISAYAFPAEYDLVFANGSIHHLPYAREVLTKVRNSLKDDGTFICVEDEHDTTLNRDKANIILSALPPVLSESREHLKPDSLKRRSAFEGACQSVSELCLEIFTMKEFKEFGCIAQWVFRFQYNWTENYLELADSIWELDKQLIKSGAYKGNIVSLICTK